MKAYFNETSQPCEYITRLFVWYRLSLTYTVRICPCSFCSPWLLLRGPLLAFKTRKYQDQTEHDWETFQPDNGVDPDLVLFSDNHKKETKYQDNLRTNLSAIREIVFLKRPSTLPDTIKCQSDIYTHI